MAKSESKRSFRYERPSREDVKARANMRGGGFDNFIKPEFKRYKVRDGKNLVRILPPTWPKYKHYGYDIWVNYGIGADNQSYLSLSKMDQEGGDKDPLVEARREAQREGDEKTAKALAPRQRVLVWIIDRNEEDEGPQLWDIPFSVDKDFVNLCLDEDTKEVSYPEDPEEGHDLRFVKEGQGMLTKYPASRMKMLAPSPLHEDPDIQQEWLDYVQENPVPDCLQFYTAEQIGAAFDGTVRTADEDADEKPAAKRPKDDDPEDKPRRPARDADPDDDPPPRSTRRQADADEDDPPPRTAKPARRERALDEGEPEPKPRRPARDPDPDEDPDPDPDERPKQSIRERLAARRQSKPDPDDD